MDILLANFMVVDDDKLVNMFCSMLIRKAFPQATVTTFDHPESGLEHIKMAYSAAESPLPTVLFLDINMPTMTAWEFLEHFEQLPDEVKKNIRVHILSSSVDERDKQRAASQKSVKAYLVKPLTKEMLLSIAG